MPAINESITSPNQSGRNGHRPRIIVYHIADGSYEGTKSWFLQSASQVSSHFVVSREGKICQCVDLANMAWCNGTTTNSGDSRYYGHASVPLVRQLGGNANWYSVSIEQEGYHAQTGGALTDAQLDATVWLTQYIAQAVRADFGAEIPFDREHLAGHCEINPKTKPCCPGEAFPWDELIARLNGAGEAASTLYRVQVGAFRSEANARSFVETVKALGYDAFLTVPDSDALYRVQVGAFHGRENAEAYVRQVKADGLDAFLMVCQP